MRNKPTASEHRTLRRIIESRGKPKPRPKGQKRFCGSWTIHGVRLETAARHQGRSKAARPPRELFICLRCMSWGCCVCGLRKAKLYRALIMRAAHRHKLTRFLTLTLNPRLVAHPDEVQVFYQHFDAQADTEKPCRCSTCRKVQARSVKYIRNCWAKLRVAFQRHYGHSPKFIAVLEFQKCTGLAHLHIVVDRYIPREWIRDRWMAAGGGAHVDIRQVDVHRVSLYLAKYLTKELLLDVPDGVRRVNTSRSIQLNQKKQPEYAWQVLKTTIDRQYVLLVDRATDEVISDDDLESFSLRE